jgi:(1->4)-alpha-D-glucan 1-alpha-D-glucosylmutase
MHATSTHDTKRSEDVRARISLLSEIPELWAEAVRRWAGIAERHRRHRRSGPSAPVPDRNTEYLLYQTLAGAWPISTDRLVPFLEKSAREAKSHTAWTRVDEEYEAALRSFAEALLADPAFVADLEAFIIPLVEPARIHSLAQTLLKLTAPGVPDHYQGSEIWDLSLVDPDNRRPVDYDLRRRLLADLEKGISPEEILARMDEGLPKMWVIHQGLHLRRRRPEVFGGAGGYRCLLARGAKADHVVAFSRADEAVTVVPRLVIRLGGDWGETALDLPEGRWRNELTGEETGGGTCRVADLLARFPVALLARV